MAPPANFVQGLLQSMAPWMTGANPSGLDNSFQQYGGTQGLLDAMLQGNTPGNLGRGMEGVQNDALQRAAARQGLAASTIGLQQNMATFPLFMRALQQYSGGQQPQSGMPQDSPQQDSSAADAPPLLRATTQQVMNGQAAPPTPAPTLVPPQNSTPQSSQGGPSLSSGLRLAGLMSLMGRPGAGTFLQSLTADPSYVTQKAVAANELTQDQAMIQQATTPEAAQAAYFKYLKDAGQVTVDRYGNVVTLGGIKPTALGVSTFLPQQGVETTNGVMRLIPGAAGTLRSKAAAEAVGKAAGDVEEVTDGNGNKYYLPRSALLAGARPNGGAGGSGGAGASAGSTPFQASVGPASEELLKEKGEQAGKVNEEFQSKAEAGQQMLAQIAELRSAASDFSPGQFAESRIKTLQWLQSIGLISPDQAKELGSAQAGQKIAIQLQAAATKQLGSREAAQIFQVMGKSLPNLTLSPDGLAKVSGYMSGIARYDIARAQIAQHRFAGNDVNGMNAVRDDFIKNTNPTYYIIASMPPAQRAEMIQSMGPKAKTFLQSWNDAANAGWAPRPGAYDGT